MQDNKLVDLSFEFAKIIVNLVDNIKVPIISCGGNHSE